jgi:hypothetical protein
MAVFCCALEGISDQEGGPTEWQCSVAHWKECLTERGDLPDGSVLLRIGRNV